MDAHEASQLVLDWHDERLAVGGDDAILLGTCENSDLILTGSHTSRSHARIEYRKQFFVLIDHSTNGTFVQTEDEQVTFVRRGELRLWGNGWIALGERLNADSAIRFRHT